MARQKTPANALTNKTCNQITDLLIGYLNGELSPRVRRDFEKHLEVCPDCVSFLRTYKKTIQSAGALDATAMPTKVRDNILTFLRKQIRRAGMIVLYLITQLAA
jgi:anti-sigma factor RsiW